MSKILIVEDKAESRYLLERLLESRGHHVITAENGEDALRLARQNPPEVIISDIMMPVMNGFRLCREVKSDSGLRNIPFIFYTATFVEEADEELAMSLGASRFILKPTEGDQFLQILDEVLNEYRQGILPVPERPLEGEDILLEMYDNSIARKLAETVEKLQDERKALIESEQRLKEAQELAHIGHWELDLKTNFLRCSDEIYRILGLKPQEFDASYEAFMAAVHPDDRTYVTKAHEESLAKKTACDIEYRVLLKDGTIKYVNEKFQTIYDDNGMPTCLMGTVQDITERKQADESLKESEERFRQFFEYAPEYCYLISPDGLIHNVNRAALNVLGYKKEELVGKPLKTIYAPEVQEKTKELFAKWRKTGRIENEELVILTKQGKRHIVLLSSAALKDKDGRLIHSISLQKDITKQKRIEKDLKESEERYRAMFDNMMNGVAIYRAENNGEDFVFIDFNKYAERMENIRKEDLVGKSVLQIFPGVKDFGLFDVFQRVWRTGKPETHPVTQYKDERILGWRENFVYKLPSGEIVSVYSDETERKKAEEALKESEEKYRLLVENAGEVVLVVQDGRFAFVNRRVFDLLGYTPEEMTGKPFVDFIHPEDRETVADRHMKRLKGEDVPPVYSFRVIDKAGETKWLEISAIRIEWEGRPATLNFLIDITERKLAEEALRERESMHRLHFENVSDVILSIDSELKVSNISPSVERVLGYKPEELIGRSFRELNVLAPEYLEQAASDTMRVLGGERITSAEYRFIARDGTKKWFEISGAPLIRYGQVVATISVARDITKRKEAEKALKEANDIISKSSSVAFTWKNREGWPVEFVSENAERLFGYTAEEFITGEVNYAGCIHPEDLERVAKEIMEVSSKAETTEFVHEPYRIIAKDGSEKIINDWTYIVRDNEGGITHYKGIVEDISERKQAEEDRDKLQAQLSNAIEMARLGHWEYDVASDLFTFNDHFYKIFRTTAKEVGGYKISSAEYAKRFVHPDDIAVVGEEIRKAIEAPGTNFRRHLEHRMIYADGTVGYISVQFFIVKDAQSKTVKTYGVNQDITDRKRAEVELKTERDTLKGLMDGLAATGIGVDVVGVDYKILHQNKVLMEAFGDLTGKLCYENYMALDIPCDLCPMEAAIKSGTVESAEMTGSDGKHYEILSAPLPSSDGVVDKAIEVVFDITDRKREEEEREKFQSQLQQTQKMEAIGTLAGGIAHDFNNILGAIIGYTEIADLQVPKDSKAKESLKEVLNAGRRARELVKQILAFSRKGELERIAIQIDPIVKEALKLLRSSLPTTIEIRQNIESDPGIIEADPTQIHQILMNLCTNASHAMREEGGILEVAIRNVEIESWDLESGYLELTPGPYLLLSVSDTGQGMKPEVLERIFEPYYTTKEKGKGTGLGLSVVHGIVKNYSGTITAYSEPGKGSTFNVYLPVIQKKGEEVPEVDEVGPIPTGNERILFIDDEPPLVKLGKQMLERLGYKVTTRTSSTEALELFKSKADQFDLVITDMTMPHMTGEKLAGELMMIRSDIPIIICTGFTWRMSEEKAKKMGVKALVMKPIVIRDLAKVVRNVLENK